jgi:hypothetical protein
MQSKKEMTRGFSRRAFEGAACINVSPVTLQLEII